MNNQFRWEPTGERRPPKFNEYIAIYDDEMGVRICKCAQHDADFDAAIYRRVPVAEGSEELTPEQDAEAAHQMSTIVHDLEGCKVPHDIGLTLFAIAAKAYGDKRFTKDASHA